MPIIETGGSIMPGSGTGRPLRLAGAPTNNVSFLGVAIVGSKLIDITNGIDYICTATNGTSTVTWTKVGLQT